MTKLVYVLVVVVLLFVACQNAAGPVAPDPPGPPPPPPVPPSGPYRLKDAEGKELPMTVRLISASYVTGGFQFAIEACVDPYDPAKFPNTSNNNIAQGMLVRFYRSRDGVSTVNDGMGGTRVANPWPGTQAICETYNQTGVIQVSHDDVKFIINWGTYGYAWQGRGYPNVMPGEPLGGVHVFDLNPPS